ncbi:hypothetical protein WJU16_23175 [Chitinophaga pollutisoli]|uniref:Uncharacterized protein n=1 Tax=Chitinophaga pollutisoli TaxID=3133966 RepID=A0ABZ2YM81_9BACT
MIRIVLHGTVGAHIIPLAKPGCVGDMFLMLGDTTFHAGHADLSRMGCDVSQWVNLRYEVRNRTAKVFVNGRDAFRHTNAKTAGALVGVSYRFEGAGAVDSVAFSRPDGSVVFAEPFSEIIPGSGR